MATYADALTPPQRARLAKAEKLARAQVEQAEEFLTRYVNGRPDTALLIAAAQLIATNYSAITTEDNAPLT